jgi:hypothetical protein
MRQYRLQSFTRYSPKQVSILLRISKLYSNPVVELYTDPWQLIAMNKFSFTGQTTLQALVSESACPDVQDNAIDVFPRHVYHYSPLQRDEIRLLHLLPATEKLEPLKVVLEHIPIGSAGEFRALSYVWGSDTRSSDLETPCGRVGVTTSLSKALRHIRRTRELLTLWVDAVCINQNDNDEKIRQIRLLPHIFQRATSTVAFLCDDIVNDHAMETLMQIKARANQSDSRADFGHSVGDTLTDGRNIAEEHRRKISSRSEEVSKWPECLPSIPSSWVGRPIPPPQDPVWEAIHTLFSNPWFRRAWVIQEVVSASSIRIICGKWLVEWNDLFGAIEIIEHEMCISKEYSSLVSSWRQFLQLATHREREARKIRMALINLLESFRHTESTLTRDRFFSLLGFAADSENPAFEPDYTSSLETIICRFAHAFIEQGKIMLLLYRAGLETNHRSGEARFPSWIPNWTVPKQPCLSESSNRGIQFSASWKTQPLFKCRPSLNEISLYGSSIDTITQISKATCTPSELGDYLNELEEMVDSLGRRFPSNKEDMKWQVPVAGAKYPRTTPDIETDLRTSYEALKKVSPIPNLTLLL